MGSESSIKDNLGNALRLLLKPIVKLFIDQGITHREFSDIVKEIYIEMAIRGQLKGGGDINKSHVAVVTGLTRKDVKKVIDSGLDKEPQRATLSRPSRVLYGWHVDIQYQNPDGTPKVLPWGSPDDDSPSFLNLVKRYSGDQSGKQLVKELLRVGAVERVPSDEGDLYRVLRRDFEADPLSEKLIARFGLLSYNMLSTQIFNLTKPSVGKGRFERAVHSTERLNDDELEDFAYYLKQERGQPFLVEIDDWLNQNVSKKTDSTAHPQPKQAGFALVEYVTENPDELKSFQQLLKDLTI